ncbi:hypothetical protein TRFO_27667 [Tritrichomonas foetus]|uniref:RRM domain-containing protein n=1 Tax=Tritrichomonas foetus TaxID=1144522 RepID=A0A1J4K556_9EUKA|nr:hypothetical protein TRFO_27667 [Tritrichomonas foetus]|eukprot:OHT04806.1 hypothetical protein TRFO_27667 [Tritrichomonas foetus]
MNSITNVFINFLPREFTKENLEHLCCPYGQIVSAKVMIDLVTGESKGFGFVRFSNNGSAIRCVQNIDGMKIGRKRLMAKLSHSVENIGTPTNSLYVKSLPKSFNQKDIWEIFHVYGKIIGIAIETSEKNGMPRGAAYITYSTIQEATSALHEMNNVILEKDCWPLFIRYTDKQVCDDTEILYGIKIKKPKSKQNENFSQKDNLDNHDPNNSCVSHPHPPPPSLLQQQYQREQKPLSSEMIYTSPNSQSSSYSSLKIYDDDMEIVKSDEYLYRQLLEEVSNDDDSD